MTDQQKQKPKTVQVINAIMHGLVQLAVWATIGLSIMYRELDPVTGVVAAGVLTGLGAVQLKNGQPPNSAILLALQGVARKFGIMAPVMALLAATTVTGCGASHAQLKTPVADACDLLESHVIREADEADEAEQTLRRVRLACSILYETIEEVM